jgi:hypothetical protein
MGPTVGPRQYGSPSGMQSRQGYGSGITQGSTRNFQPAQRYHRGRRTRRRLELLLQDLAALVEATAEGPLAAVLAADSAVVVSVVDPAAVSVADPRAAVLAAEATVSEVAAVAAAGDDRTGVASDEPAHVKLDPLGQLVVDFPFR